MCVSVYVCVCVNRISPKLGSRKLPAVTPQLSSNPEAAEGRTSSPPGTGFTSTRRTHCPRPSNSRSRSSSAHRRSVWSCGRVSGCPSGWAAGPAVSSDRVFRSVSRSAQHLHGQLQEGPGLPCGPVLPDGPVLLHEGRPGEREKTGTESVCSPEEHHCTRSDR